MTILTETQSGHRFGSAAAVATVLAVWFAAALALVATGALKVPPGQPPVPLLLTIAVPVGAFLAAYRLSGGFRTFVLTLSLRLVTVLHAWRTVGFSFIVLYAYGLLPGLFAFPAALGDMAVAVTAPAVAMALAARPEFATSGRFALWHILGLLDFVVAVGIGASLGMDALGAPAMAPMLELPLAIIPVFAVPVFVLLHLTALLQWRHLRHLRQMSAA